MFNFPFQWGTSWAANTSSIPGHFPDTNSEDSRSDWEYDIPAHLQVAQAAEWIDLPRSDGNKQTASCSFTLPSASDTLLFLARGPFSHGSMNISQAETLEEGETRDVVVTVTATFWDRGRFMQNLKVCQVQGIEAEGEDHGVGIFTRRNDIPMQENIDLNLQVSVILPKNLPGHSLIYLPNLQADMKLFSYDIADLSTTVVFESVSLRTENMAINAKSLFANSINVETINSPITGSFHATSSLGLFTCNAMIHAVIALANDQDDGPSEAILKTSNAPINASINLTSVQQVGGTFKVETDTSLAPLNIAFLTAPVDSILHLKARTAMGWAKVQLHPTYQGDFDVSTTMASLRVSPDSEKGPAVDGRLRTVEIDDQTVWRARGRAYWGQGRDGQPKGSVQAHTVMGPAELVI